MVLALNKENLYKFIEVAKALGLKPKIPVKLDDLSDGQKRKEWAETKNMTVFSLYDPKNPFLILDVFIREPFDFEKVYKLRAKLNFENTTISVVPIKELITMKEKTGRPQDEADAFHLKKIMREWKNEK